MQFPSLYYTFNYFYLATLSSAFDDLYFTYYVIK